LTATRTKTWLRWATGAAIDPLVHPQDLLRVMTVTI
jgi:hypothetical protein